MYLSTQPADDIYRLVEQFGIAVSPWLDGPNAECPICSGAIDQLALTLDLSGYETLECGDCGAVLAA
jgi:hypothetical protein